MKYKNFKKFLSFYKDTSRFIKEIPKPEIFKIAENSILEIMPNIQIPDYKVYKVSQFVLWERTAWVSTLRSDDGEIIWRDIFITPSFLNHRTAIVGVLHEIIHTLEKEKSEDENIQEFFVQGCAMWIAVNNKNYATPREYAKYKKIINSKEFLDIPICFERLIKGDVDYLEEQYKKLIEEIYS